MVEQYRKIGHTLFPKLLCFDSWKLSFRESWLIERLGSSTLISSTSSLFSFVVVRSTSMKCITFASVWFACVSHSSAVSSHIWLVWRFLPGDFFGFWHEFIIASRLFAGVSSKKLPEWKQSVVTLYYSSIMVCFTLSGCFLVSLSELSQFFRLSRIAFHVLCTVFVATSSSKRVFALLLALFYLGSMRLLLRLLSFHPSSGISFHQS